MRRGRRLGFLAVAALFGLSACSDAANDPQSAPAARAAVVHPAIPSHTASARADEILSHALENGALTREHRDDLVSVIPSLTPTDKAELEARMREAALRGDLVIATNP
jgi:hypothetical protein